MYNTYYMMYIHDRILDVLDSIHVNHTLNWWHSDIYHFTLQNGENVYMVILTTVCQFFKLELHLTWRLCSFLCVVILEGDWCGEEKQQWPLLLIWLSWKLLPLSRIASGQDALIQVCGITTRICLCQNKRNNYCSV